MMLERSGIDPDKETEDWSPSAPMAARFAALQRRTRRGGDYRPACRRLRRARSGLNVLARANDLFKFPHIGLGTTNKKLTENPQEVTRVIQAFIKANRFVRDHRQEAINVLADWGRTRKRKMPSHPTIRPGRLFSPTERCPMTACAWCSTTRRKR